MIFAACPGVVDQDIRTVELPLDLVR